VERTVRADAATPITKPLPPREFVDFTDGEHGYNAETRWEALAKTGYLTPDDHFFIRSLAPPPAWTPRAGGCTWKDQAWSALWSSATTTSCACLRSRGRSSAVGNVQPDEVEWNDLGYLYDGVVGHPVEVV
jgi:hypothetical protein